MKVFLYIRVACADQLAAANQREELERYAKDKGYEVAAAVAADGISGVHTEGIMNFLLACRCKLIRTGNADIKKCFHLASPSDVVRKSLNFQTISMLSRS